MTDKLLGRYHFDMLGIKRHELVAVEQTVALADTGQVKRGDQLLDRHNFPSISGIPAQDGKKINHRFRQIAAAEKVHDIDLRQMNGRLFGNRIDHRHVRNRLALDEQLQFLNGNAARLSQHL